MPRRISGQKKSDMPLCVVNCDHCHIANVKMNTPTSTSRRGSTRPRKRAIAAMVTALAIAPGRITSPVWFAVRPMMFCR